MKKLKIGWAQASITPTRPVVVIGQMYHRESEYVRDPILATALALDDAQTHAVIVSLDMTEYPIHIEQKLRQRLRDVEGLCFENISIGVTHTHNSSDFYSDFMREDNERVFGADRLPQITPKQDLLDGEAAQDFLAERLADVITRAWEGRRFGGVAAAHEYAAIAFNRRPVFQRGEEHATVMYGDCSRADFVRFENGADTSVELLYTFDERGEVTGVAVNVPCPSQVFELHRFVSADYWCYARAAIRERLGNVHILPLCGAAGDLAPLDLVRISKDNRQALLDWGAQAGEVFRNFDMTRECEQIGWRICDAVMRGYRVARNYIEYTPEFRHATLRMELPLRMVSPEEYEASAQQIERIRERFSSSNRMTMRDVVAAFDAQGDVLRWELQQTTQVYAFKCHVLRIGRVALATNPFELYHEFALRMKARVKAEQLFVVQLSNGLGGYLPTELAIAGGSYSSKAASTTCGPDGGNTLVEKTIAAVDALFEDA